MTCDLQKKPAVDFSLYCWWYALECQTDFFQNWQQDDIEEEKLTVYKANEWRAHL